MVDFIRTGLLCTWISYVLGLHVRIIYWSSYTRGFTYWVVYVLQLTYNDQAPDQTNNFVLVSSENSEAGETCPGQRLSRSPVSAG